MRIGVDYRLLAVGPALMSRGIPRYTQQQLRAVLGIDRDNEYVLLCREQDDVSLIAPSIREAPNVEVRTWADEPPAIPFDSARALRHAEEYQEWVSQQDIDLYHATAVFILLEPVLADFDVCPVVGTLFDLLPFIFPAHFLAGGIQGDLYLRSISFLTRSRRLVAISHASGNDAVRYLGFPPDRIDVAWPVADQCFRRMEQNRIDRLMRNVRKRHPIPDRYAMTITWFAHTKSLDVLLAGYARLPRRVRAELGLVVCGHFYEEGVRRGSEIAARFGIEDDVVFVGNLSEDELAALYNAATLVVCPSRYEGFGLPALEAMSCGTPVIASTAASLPEVVGDAAVLVDPLDPLGMTEAMLRIHQDGELRADLRQRGQLQASRFNVDQLARNTLDCYRKAVAPVDGGDERSRVAIWTPFPPQPSKVSDHAVDLVGRLDAHSEVEVFVDDGVLPSLEMLRRFRIHHHSAFARRQRQRPFDAVLYELESGHPFVEAGLKAHPGVADLHDGLPCEPAPPYGEDGPGRVGLDHIVQNSVAQIVHSVVEKTDLEVHRPGAHPYFVPLGVADPYRGRPLLEAQVARRRLGLGPGTFVIGAFGAVHAGKRLDVCVRALADLLSTRADSRLVVVGGHTDPAHGRELSDMACELGVADRLWLTGFVPREDFDGLLMASDIVVDLRSPSTSPLSASLVRALAAARPLVISDLPEWRSFPDELCRRVPTGSAELPCLVEELRTLAADAELRQRMSEAARRYFEQEATLDGMAGAYTDVLELVRGHRWAGRRHRVSPAAPVSTPASPPLPLAFNKACDIADFRHPDLVPVIGDVCAYKVLPPGGEDRKDWEAAMVVRALTRFGAVRPDALILGVAAGVDDTLFYLTRHVRQVFAVDRYVSADAAADGAAGNGSRGVLSAMLVDPTAVAPMEFDASRLIVQHMDTRRLRFPDDTFDGIFSPGIGLQFANLDDVAQAVSEMGRVLKPGGVLSLSIPLRLSGPPGGMGWPGRTLLFSEDMLQRYVVEASGLELVEPPQLDVSDETLTTPRNLVVAVAGYVDERERQGGRLDGPDTALFELPHLVLVADGYVLTSVHLALRKTEGYSAASNAWARGVADGRADGPWPTGVARTPGQEHTPARSNGYPVDSEPTDDTAATPEAVAASLQDEKGSIEQRVAYIDEYRHAVKVLLRELDVQEQSQEHSAEGVPSSVGSADSRLVVRQLSLSERPLRSGGEGPVQVQVVLDPMTTEDLVQALVDGSHVQTPLVDVLLDLVRPGDAVVDVGAHVGLFSLAAAAAGCRVLAVEADPGHAVRVRASASRNGFFDLRVVNAAASDEAGTVAFVPGRPRGYVTRSPVESTITVPALAVDDLLAEMGWGRVAVLKLDVGGSEIAATAGMLRLLTPADAPAVLYECNAHALARSGAVPADLIEAFQNLGYVSYLVDTGRLVRTLAFEVQPNMVVDYLAVKHPPVALGTRWMQDRMTTDERVARLVEESRSPDPERRAYVARAAAANDGELARFGAIAQALATLGDDPIEEVRAATGWWTGGETTTRAKR